MVAVADGQEPDERNLHASKCAQGIPRRVADVQPRAISSHAKENKHMQGNQVGDEDIASPRGHHVPIEKRREGSPHDRSVLDSLDPQEKGEDQQEDGNRLIVVATRNRTRDITRSNAHEGSRKKTGRRRVGHFAGEKIHGERCQSGECWRKQNTDVPDVDRNGEESQNMVDHAAGYHQTRVERATSDTSQRVPCS